MGDILSIDDVARGALGVGSDGDLESASCEVAERPTEAGPTLVAVAMGPIGERAVDADAGPCKVLPVGGQHSPHPSTDQSGECRSLARGSGDAWRAVGPGSDPELVAVDPFGSSRGDGRPHRSAGKLQVRSCSSMMSSPMNLTLLRRSAQRADVAILR